jgi:N-acyl-L-homoserine lactone synthetase
MQINNSRYLPISFFEQNFEVKNLTNLTERESAYRLRHKIFVDELKWVKPQSEGLEIDFYDDEGMVPLGVFDRLGRLIAHLRITLPQRTFMMEKEFAALIETPIRKTNSTVEISRVCTEAEARAMKILTPHGYTHVSMLLYKGLYCWCCKNFISKMCMVIEKKLFRLLRMSGFPCQVMGKTIIMPDGVSAVAVKIDWRVFESINEKSKPQLLAWFNNTGINNENSYVGSYYTSKYCAATATA